MVRVALVTGASSGIGEATSRALAREGFQVALVARGRDALLGVEERIRAAGGAARVYATDATSGAAVLAMAERVRAEMGLPHVIVNCAGAGEWRFLEDTPPEDAMAMMGVPYFAACFVTHAFLGAMIQHQRGIIVHVNSPAARIPWPGATGYVAARWALRGLHEALCQDLRGTGVRSVLVTFGKVSSDYFAHNPGSEERLPRVTRIIRTLGPEECARVIVRAVRRPRKEIVAPFVLRLFYWIDALWPGLTRWLAAATSPVRRSAR